MAFNLLFFPPGCARFLPGFRRILPGSAGPGYTRLHWIVPGFARFLVSANEVPAPDSPFDLLFSVGLRPRGSRFLPGVGRILARRLPGLRQSKKCFLQSLGHCPSELMAKIPIKRAALFYLETCQLPLTFALDTFAIGNVHTLAWPPLVHALCRATCR